MTFKHKKVKRNYLERMSNNKILCMNTSKNTDMIIDVIGIWLWWI